MTKGSEECYVQQCNFSNEHVRWFLTTLTSTKARNKNSNLLIGVNLICLSILTIFRYIVEIFVICYVFLTLDFSNFPNTRNNIVDDLYYRANTDECQDAFFGSV